MFTKHSLYTVHHMFTSGTPCRKKARIKVKCLLILSLERQRITRQGGPIGYGIWLEAWLGLKLGSIYRGLLS